MKHPLFRMFVLMALLLAAAGSRAVTPLVPAGDDEVVEILPAVTTQRPARGVAGAPAPQDAAQRAAQARSDISLARQTGDTRYWGRAQALLAPWWDRSDAPVEIAVLQATVQQGRHEFDAARRVLGAALARAPGHAQGWLNLASLERLQGRYADALLACSAVGRAGAALYAQACQLETGSLQGRQSEAQQGLQQLAMGSQHNGQRAWLLSLLAESLERAGQDVPALAAYRRSLALEHDLYTAIALSDLLLRSGDMASALQVLEPLPETDAVLLRRARAWRVLGDARWRVAHSLLGERAQELLRRGDDPQLHARELALIALWLDDDAPRALELALHNLQLQREPIDWWVALRSAGAAGDAQALGRVREQLRTAGLRDLRLDGAASPAKVASGARP